MICGRFTDFIRVSQRNFGVLAIDLIKNSSENGDRLTNLTKGDSEAAGMVLQSPVTK